MQVNGSRSGGVGEDQSEDTAHFDGQTLGISDQLALGAILDARNRSNARTGHMFSQAGSSPQ